MFVTLWNITSDKGFRKFVALINSYIQSMARLAGNIYNIRKI